MLQAAGGDAIRQVPPSRWLLADPSLAAARYGAFIPAMQHFDNAFFGIAPAEAQAMDPQQRLLLENSFQALHASGLAKADLLGTVTGVHVGVWSSEYMGILFSSPAGSSSAAAGGGVSVSSGGSTGSSSGSVSIVSADGGAGGSSGAMSLGTGV